MTVRLHVNVDHVATLRQARGTRYPDPVAAATVCELAGADGITVHLREDRRHIQDRDVVVLRETVGTLLNLEMAATDAMVAFAARVRPDLVTLVPEKREERTTEGGLDVAGSFDLVRSAVARLHDAGIVTSLFVDPSRTQIDASRRAGAAIVELHTGDYANARGAGAATELARLVDGAAHAWSSGLRVAAGHGLTLRNVGAVAAIVSVEELNIGHAIVADSVLVGLAEAVRRMRAAIDAGRAPRSS
ncbi:MAG: pyridoxine 5'-phosphate synthase [Deltaproteobacteria bacterium]|nr:pyridoxine 5'-phosphate synthase [Deltaproteobacteria bacterium]